MSLQPSRAAAAQSSSKKCSVSNELRPSRRIWFGTPSESKHADCVVCAFFEELLPPRLCFRKATCSAGLVLVLAHEMI
jgi:hypothetical protein